jgi:hypothetical protein
MGWIVKAAGFAIVAAQIGCSSPVDPVVGIENKSSEGPQGDTWFLITTSPDAGVLPDAGVVPDAGVGTITVEVDFVCGTVTMTKQYQVMGPITLSGGLSIVGV